MNKIKFFILGLILFSNIAIVKCGSANTFKRSKSTGCLVNIVEEGGLKGDTSKGISLPNCVLSVNCTNHKINYKKIFFEVIINVVAGAIIIPIVHELLYYLKKYLISSLEKDKQQKSLNMKLVEQENLKDSLQKYGITEEDLALLLEKKKEKKKGKNNKKERKKKNE